MRKLDKPLLLIILVLNFGLWFFGIWFVRVVFFTEQNFGADLIEIVKPVEIADELKLKVENKEDILFKQEKDWIECDELNKKCVNKGKIAVYDYVTTQKVPAKKYGGLNEDITKRTRSAEFYRVNASTTIMNVYSGGNYYKKGEDWYLVAFGATTTIEAYNKQMDIEKEPISFWRETLKIYNVYADSATDYAGAGDGLVEYYYGTTWAEARNGTTGAKITAYPSITSDHIKAEKEGTGVYVVGRAFFPLDTSSLPDGASISAAAFYLYGDAASQSGSQTFGLVQTTQASNTTLESSDFFDCGSKDSATEGTDSRVSRVSGGYMEFTLNATGIGWISDTGYTNLGVRGSNDLDDSEPSARDYYRVHYSEYSGTDTDPYISITYTEGGGGTDPCTPTPGQPFFQSTDCYIKSDVYHNERWINDGHKLINDGGKLIIDY